MSRILTLFLWSLFAWNVHAFSYRYVLTYGADNFICHADITLSPFSDPTHAPLVTTHSIYCVMVNDEPGATFDIPEHSEGGPNGAVVYTLNLGPVNQHGHYGVEIGINQPGITFANNVHTPALAPRLDFYFDIGGRPLGACSYRQGALQLAQHNGEAATPYTCPSEAPRGTSVGRWTACLFSCSKF